MRKTQPKRFKETGTAAGAVLTPSQLWRFSRQHSARASAFSPVHGLLIPAIPWQEPLTQNLQPGKQPCWEGKLQPRIIDPALSQQQERPLRGDMPPSIGHLVHGHLALLLRSCLYPNISCKQDNFHNPIRNCSFFKNQIHTLPLLPFSQARGT